MDSHRHYHWKGNPEVFARTCAETWHVIMHAVGVAEKKGAAASVKRLSVIEQLFSSSLVFPMLQRWLEGKAELEDFFGANGSKLLTSNSCLAHPTYRR